MNAWLIFVIVITGVLIVERVVEWVAWIRHADQRGENNMRPSR